MVQAIELNRKILSSTTEPASAKAKAICWLAHLVADIHQPCHAGSLYIENVYPEGDRGANSIKTRQSRNMHALWDQLLGRAYDAFDVRRRAVEITEDAELQRKFEELEAHAEFDSPVLWVQESRELALKAVYTESVLEYVQSGDKSASLVLSEEYLKAAGDTSQAQTYIAAKRLSNVWKRCLTND